MRNNKVEIIYSIAIILAIPTILVANTVFLANNARQDFVTEIRRKADLVNQSVAAATSLYINNDQTEDLQSYINQLTAESPSLYDVYVAVPNGSTYDIIASKNQEIELKTYQTQHLNFTKDTDNPIARKTDVLDKAGNKTTAWDIATPVKDENNNTVAIAVSSVTTADADELINNTYLQSFLFLAVSIIVIIALLLHHFKIAGYSRLLAKQKEINQTMTDFLSVATHELKAPTSIIKGYISNVTDGTFGEVSDEIKTQLFVALTQTDRLNNLVQDLLNVSRVEQGRIEYNLKTVDMDIIINGIVGTYKQRAQDKGLELIYNNAEQANTSVIADEGRAQEIFTNLIDNSIKYTPQGSVTINFQKDKKYLITKIRDTGLGISAEDRKRLFQRFFRVRNDQTKDISGTGLGLWIIKQYIEAMGGRIEVDSLVGSGTEFTVYLPLAQ